MTKFKFVTSYEDEAGIVVIFDASFTPGDPGRCSGPPERCYPPEPPEVELDNPMVDEGSHPVKRWKHVYRQITDQELKLIGVASTEELIEKVIDDRFDEIVDEAQKLTDRD